jgi:hypothetical protein
MPGDIDEEFLNAINSHLKLRWAVSRCVLATGFHYEFLCEFHTRYIGTVNLGASRDDLFATLVVLRNDLKWDAAAAFADVFNPGLSCSERTLRRAVNEILNPVVAGTLIDRAVNRGLRFAHMDPALPGITAMVDATPVPCRGNRSLLNMKYRAKVVKFEVWTTLWGVPIYWRGPFLPTAHDASIYQSRTAEMGQLPQRPSLPHLPLEFFAGDKGYQGMSHMVSPFKTTDAEGNQPARGQDVPTREYFDLRFVSVRNRIEHFFSRLDEWKIMHNCAHHMKWLGYAMDLIMTMMHLKEAHNAATKGCRYDARPPPAVAHDAFGQVRCACRFLVTDAAKQRARQKRSQLVEHFITTNAPPCPGKPEKKRRRERQGDDLGVENSESERELEDLE